MVAISRDNRWTFMFFSFAMSVYMIVRTLVRVDIKVHVIMLLPFVTNPVLFNMAYWRNDRAVTVASVLKFFNARRLMTLKSSQIR